MYVVINALSLSEVYCFGGYSNLKEKKNKIFSLQISIEEKSLIVWMKKFRTKKEEKLKGKKNRNNVT